METLLTLKELAAVLGHSEQEGHPFSPPKAQPSEKSMTTFAILVKPLPNIALACSMRKLTRTEVQRLRRLRPTRSATLVVMADGQLYQPASEGFGWMPLFPSARACQA